MASIWRENQSIWTKKELAYMRAHGLEKKFVSQGPRLLIYFISLFSFTFVVQIL
jgi:hypothetical protein